MAPWTRTVINAESMELGFAGIVNTILLELADTMDAKVPSTSTESFPGLELKPEPLIVTWIPALPCVGLKDVTVTVRPELVLLQLSEDTDKRQSRKRTNLTLC
jgi:hypothetical protein